MGVILIILFLVFIARRQKTNIKKNRHKPLFGKTDWEKTCDDGGRFFGW